MTSRAIGFRERVNLAWQVLTARPRHNSEQKVVPLAWPAFREGRPQWQLVNMESYVNEGFNANSLIYSALIYKMRAMQAAPLRAYIGDVDNPERADLKHPLAQLALRPNKWMSGIEFQGLADIYLNVTGNCYVLFDRTNIRSLPESMYLLRPDRVYIIPKNSRELLGYVYVAEGKSVLDGVPILPQDLMHVKLPNPGDPLDGLGYGLSPISPGSRSTDVDNSATKFLKQFFDKGAMINLYASYDAPMDDDVMARTKARLMEIYGGHANWGEIAVMDNAGKIDNIGFNLKDMMFDSLD